METAPGQPWWTAAGVEHWHGASPTEDALQLTIYEGDVKWLEPADWRSGVSGKAGIKLGGPAPERGGVTLLLEAYEGFAPFGQFFVEDFKYHGVTLQFDF